MKRLLILLLVLLNFGYGQRLVRVGAEWTFDDFIPFGPPPYIIHSITVKITKDTVINGIQCQKTVIGGENLPYQEKYLLERNDSVFIYVPDSQAFKLMYNFAAQVGDTMLIYFPEYHNPWGRNEFRVVVDSIGYKTIGGKQFYAYHQRCADDSCGTEFLIGANGWVIDTIGGVIDDAQFIPQVLRPTYLFPGGPSYADPPPYHYLRCYKYQGEVKVNLYDYLYPGKNFGCYAPIIIDSTGSAELYTGIDNKLSGIKIYPTIVYQNSEIIVETPKQLSIKIFDLAGREYFPEMIKTQDKYIIHSNLPRGIYFLQINDKSSFITKKIVVI